MKRIVLAVILLQIVLSAHAIPYGTYDLKQIVILSESPSGQHSATVNFVHLDAIVNDLSSHAGGYPPHFDSKDDAQRAQRDVKVLAGLLDTLLQNPPPNAELLRRSAVLNSIGHNLDIPGTGERAVSAYTTLLSLLPSDPRLNFSFGKFLAQAGKPSEAIPYLDKAKALGAANADYTLGLTYLALGDKSKALENLDAYAKRVPDDANAAKIIDAIRNGTVQFKPGRP